MLIFFWCMQGRPAGCDEDVAVVQGVFDLGKPREGFEAGV